MLMHPYRRVMQARTIIRIKSVSLGGIATDLVMKVHSGTVGLPRRGFWVTTTGEDGAHNPVVVIDSITLRSTVSSMAE